ncbi:MAG: ATP-dependent protease ATPase subunit HslU [Planctomycetota bacterium]|jgi:ATP-dependent HslUV protease ATP-binding subunit HslU
MQLVNPIVKFDDMTPKEIMSALDSHVIGQDDAKRAVSLAIRNRWRRQQLEAEVADEVTPKNIIMIGPTGVGKTEIARRLAAMMDAPFIKVEASKYTEVGYQGRDVESMIRDLVKVSVGQVQSQYKNRVMSEAENQAEERLLDLLLPAPSFSDDPEKQKEEEGRLKNTREKFRKKLRAGELDDRMVEIRTRQAAPTAGIIGMAGGEEMGFEMQEMLEKMLPEKRKDRRVSIKDARKVIANEEAEKLVDEEEVTAKGIERAEQSGIIFLDEIDKLICSNRADGPDVSREGVQRDLLPIVEGSTVNTKYGMVHTEHILFIAAGAFHGKNPNDLIPELQGRFPIRVSLDALTKEDFERILIHPKNALTRQVELLLATEGLKVKFEKTALKAMAEIAANVNQSAQDIGARRLHTIMEKLMEDISFNAPDMKGEKISISKDLVYERLKDLSEDEDLSKYIL